jgi:hypothetical protein
MGSMRKAALGALVLALFGAAGCRGEERQAEATPVAQALSQYDENDALADRVAAEWSGATPTIAVYKTPQCGCCTAWVHHVERAGFPTEVLDLPDLAPIKQQYGITREVASCHTSIVDGYVVEGHVPADAIARLLRERPDIAGIAVAGMPMGSPGMEGPFRDAYDIVALGRDGSRSVWERRE